MTEAVLNMKIAELEFRLERIERLLETPRLAVNKFMTIDECADMLNVTSMTVYNKVHSGEITAVKVGRVWRIPTQQFKTKM